jgi:FtsP/CotA-like multicopper oxidase with cupredoxin domain
MPSRRDLLKLGLLATPGVSLGHLVEAGVGDPGSPPTFPFTRALAIPPQLQTSGPQPPGQDSYAVNMQVAMANIIQGRQTPVWTYNGSYPGPTIRARAGRQVNVRFTNNLSESMSVHLHGGRTAPTSDGHPNDLITQGNFKDYTYPNNQLPAPLWYHDHAVDVTGPHLYMGLAGFYIMSDTAEDNLNLPGPGPNGPFEFDVPLLVQDRMFNHNGTLSYPLTEDALIRGVLGDRILVNGVIQPFFQVGRRKYRFRLLNGSNARIYDFALSNGQNFRQIGSDGGLFDAPVDRPVIRLGPAERADVVIDFTQVPNNSSFFLRNLNRMVPLTVDRAARDIMRFDVGNNVNDNSNVPGTLRAFTPPPTQTVDRDFLLTRGVQNGRTVWFINGQLFDPGRIDVDNIALGTTERWTFTNNSNVSHPMHVHLVQFVVEGAGAGDNRWKDTVNVPPGAAVRVRATFTGFAGTYVFHCHVLEHEDHAMMAQFRTV